jgi:hypothetical protein
MVPMHRGDFDVTDRASGGCGCGVCGVAVRWMVDSTRDAARIVRLYEVCCLRVCTRISSQLECQLMPGMSNVSWHVHAGRPLCSSQRRRCCNRVFCDRSETCNEDIVSRQLMVFAPNTYIVQQDIPDPSCLPTGICPIGVSASRTKETAVPQTIDRIARMEDVAEGLP